MVEGIFSALPTLRCLPAIRFQRNPELCRKLAGELQGRCNEYRRSVFEYVERGPGGPSPDGSR